MAQATKQAFPPPAAGRRRTRISIHPSCEVSVLIRILCAGSLLLAVACRAPEAAPARPTEPFQPFQPFLSLRPVSAGLVPGASQAFQAELNYPDGVRPPVQPVVWRVMEPGGGTISATGLYTATPTPGVYHVQVLRVDFPEITAVAAVRVK
jgi:hypothetical protein